MTRRLTQRGKARRQELLDFATARFAENGYHPTLGHRDRAGRRRGQRCLLLVLREQGTAAPRDPERCPAKPATSAAARHRDEPDPVRRIELGIRASLEWSAAHHDVNNLIQFASTDGRFMPALERGEETAVADVMRHVDDGIAIGQIRDVDSRMLAHRHPRRHHPARTVFIHDRGRPASEVADAAVAFVLDGLLAPAPTASARH